MLIFLKKIIIIIFFIFLLISITYYLHVLYAKKFNSKKERDLFYMLNNEDDDDDEFIYPETIEDKIEYYRRLWKIDKDLVEYVTKTHARYFRKYNKDYRTLIEYLESEQKQLDEENISFKEKILKLKKEAWEEITNEELEDEWLKKEMDLLKEKELNKIEQELKQIEIDKLKKEYKKYTSEEDYCLLRELAESLKQMKEKVFKQIEKALIQIEKERREASKSKQLDKEIKQSTSKEQKDPSESTSSKEQKDPSESTSSNTKVIDNNIKKENDSNTETAMLDSDVDMNYTMLDFPWPASENMNSLSILYWEVNYTVLFIFSIVVLLLCETVRLHKAKKKKNRKIIEKKQSVVIEEQEKIPYFNMYPSYFSSEEEHFIDVFVILIPTLIVLNIIVPTLGYIYNDLLI